MNRIYLGPWTKNGKNGKNGIEYYRPLICPKQVLYRNGCLFRPGTPSINMMTENDEAYILHNASFSYLLKRRHGPLQELMNEYDDCILRVGLDNVFTPNKYMFLTQEKADKLMVLM